MRKLALILLLTLPFVGESANAQSGAMEVICEDCRDPVRYPEDWANFAFNQVYGPNGWMNLDQADDFYVVNLQGQRVYVDLDFVMGGIRILGNTLPLWPKNLLMVTLALPNGQIVRYLRSVFQHPLPVPAPTVSSSSSGVQIMQPEHEWPDRINEIDWEDPDSDRQ